ncbi:unnamed protein product, partial [Medioppia subpectinata]
MAREYGPVFTFWLGGSPHVVVADTELAREAFRRNEFAGRPKSYFGGQLSNEEHRDVAFTDYGHTWEALRRVAHSAVQKYSTNDKLVVLANDCVDRCVKDMIDKEGVGKPFAVRDYVYLMVLNILATSTFGQSYGLDDPEFRQIKYSIYDFRREAGARLLLWEFSPIIRLLDKSLVKKQRMVWQEMKDTIRKKFIKHYDDYNELIERDFCDALISAKNDALRDGKESAPYLTDTNLSMAIIDLFIAGTDTTQQTFQWIILLMTYYPEMQQKLRQEIEQEIESQIGDRMPTHEDRNRCHYVMAFIAETLRARNPLPSALPHKAVVTSNYTIPKDTAVFVYQGIILRNDSDWENAEKFIPERFVDSAGQFITTRPKAYIPFGVGRRVCPGERLAIADLFLILVRFLQLTQDYEITVDSELGIKADPNITDSYSPLPPGPFPLPIIGNVLAFKSTKSVFDVFKDFGYEYGPVYTFWIFNRPHVMVTDVDIAREAFRKNDFAGRPDSYFGSQLSNDRFQDVLFTDYGHTWEALRRVALSAAQKYSTNDKLVYLAVDCVDQTVKEMLNREGTDRAFNPQNYIYLMFLNIMSASAFGQRFILYNIEDKEFKQIKYALKDFGKEAGSRFLLWEFSPLLRFLDKKLAQKQRTIIAELVEMIR